METSIAPPEPTGTARKRTSPAAKLVLTALVIDLAATKSGSYLGVRGVPLFLPDVLLGLGGLLAALSLRHVSRTGLAMSVVLVLFSVAQLLRPGSGPFLVAVRDVAPYLYLALVPFLALALRGLDPRVLLRCVRGAVIFLAVSLALRLGGLLDPISVPFAGIPLFSPRDDAEAVVLGIGIVAFGRHADLARASRTMQVLLLVLALLSYSRAGLLAVLLCVAVAAARESEFWARTRVVQVIAATAAVLCIAAMALLLVGLDKLPVEPPQALQRLLETDTSAGTTGARLTAWQLLLDHADATGTTSIGLGPGTQPVLESGAVAYLSGDITVRAAHNWAVSAIAYFGTIGLALWLVAVAVYAARAWRARLRSLAVASVGAYGIAAALGVIVESPFGSLPIAVMLAYLVAERHGPGRAGLPSRARRPTARPHAPALRRSARGTAAG